MDLHDRQQRILAELRMHGTVSVADFAQRIGVSPMTVRRDLRELADAGRVRRIHGGAEAVEAEAFGGVRHRPAPRAGGDASGADAPLFTLGLITPDPSYYFPQIVDGAVERTRALGGRVVLGVSLYEAERERAQIARMLSGGADALLVTTTVADSFDRFAQLSEAPVPVVMVERSVENAPVGDELESVRTDHSAGAVIGIRHLAELGHERIGMYFVETPSAPFLRVGVRRALERLDLPPVSPVAEVPEGDSGDLARSFLRSALDAGVTAVLAHSDHYAVELTGIALEMGLDVPGDLSILTFDDSFAALAAVPLTAVTPPGRDIGRLAAAMAFERLASTDTVSAARHVTLRPRLTVRESTGPRR